MIEVPALGYLNFKSKLWNPNCKVWNQTVFTKPVTLFTKQIRNIYMNPLEYKVIKKSVFAFLNAMVQVPTTPVPRANEITKLHKKEELKNV